MKKATFKRHGFADLLYLQAVPVFVEYHHLSGFLEIQVAQGHGWNLVHRGLTEYRGESPLLAVPEIEALIKMHTGITVSINPEFVEAYMVTSHKPLYAFTAQDKQFFKGVCIDGLTVQQVQEKTSLDFQIDLGYYNIEQVIDLLEAKSEKLMNMPFAEFVTMLHDHHYKRNFRAIVQARVI